MNMVFLQFKVMHKLFNGLRASSCLLMALLCMGQASDALASSASAIVNTNQMDQDENLFLTVTYEGDNGRQSDFDTGVLMADFFPGYPSFSSSYSNINGKSTTKLTWQVALQPKKSGRLRIPAMAIADAQTQAIEINVSPNTKAKPAQSRVQFKATLSRDHLFPNESATMHTELIIKGQGNFDRHKFYPPQADGLEIHEVNDRKQKDSVVNGIPQLVLTQDYLVTANQPGQFVIKPPRFTGQLITGSLYSQKRSLRIDVQDDDILVTVKEKPSQFNGEWLPTTSLDLQQIWTDDQGNSLQDKLPNITLEQGQSVTRTITLTIANLAAERFPELSLNLPKSVRVYDQKPQFSVNKQGETVMTMTQVIIPKVAGDISIPSFSLPWWDSDRSLSQQATLDAITLKVAALDADTQPAVASQPAPACPTTAPVANEQSPFIWQLATAIFALLWIVTLLVLINRRSPASVSQATLPTSNHQPTDLLRVIAEKDGLRLQNEIKKWLISHSHLTSAQQQQVKTETDRIIQQLYKGDPQSVSWDKLQQLIKQLGKQAGNKTKGNNSHLGSL